MKNLTSEQISKIQQEAMLGRKLTNTSPEAKKLYAEIVSEKKEMEKKGIMLDLPFELPNT